MNSNNVPYRISTYDKHKIIVLKEQGLSVTDIANELGITVSLHLLLLCFKRFLINKSLNRYFNIINLKRLFVCVNALI